MIKVIVVTFDGSSTEIITFLVETGSSARTTWVGQMPQLGTTWVDQCGYSRYFLGK